MTYCVACGDVIGAGERRVAVWRAIIDGERSRWFDMRTSTSTVTTSANVDSERGVAHASCLA